MEKELRAKERKRGGKKCDDTCNATETGLSNALEEQKEKTCTYIIEDGSGRCVLPFCALSL